MSLSDNPMIKVGISACLLGDEVRYDGGHKRFGFCTDELSRHVEFVKYCPEVGIGLSTPRDTIQLQQSSRGTRAVINKTGIDVTDALQSFAERVGAVSGDLSGYIFCAKSPSCGMERVKLYDSETGHAKKAGIGIFAARIKQRFPALPTEENGRLNDPLLRENFIMRVFVYAEWQQLLAGSVSHDLNKADLLAFHQRLKLLLLAHDQQAYRQLGRLLAEQQSTDAEFCQRYIEATMAALSQPASRRNQTNVLQHIQGYFKHDLSADEKQELSQLILDYHQGIEPLLAPLTLLQHFQRLYPKDYLQQQRYLQPYPKSLKLRYGL
ncbi:YbgA family protein [Idiomarina xiamenensis]|uniref:DUF1722 domain-containing protein n=1 Tax=Idiomarina xiamenensis 10-D-4 TaxID=740709 RepID=K2KWN3_9GAMM|nr:DUF523 and DUF1722 domain-containing protein [Idiomarina xiamenensis]EKE86899.1 hypothetical protein A10D4_01617 [Idiomarina xiamenensis 10-D-4]